MASVRPQFVTYSFKLYPEDYLPKAGQNQIPPPKQTGWKPEEGYITDDLLDQLMLNWLKRSDPTLSFELQRPADRHALLQLIIQATFPQSPFNEKQRLVVDSKVLKAVKGLPYALQLAYYYVYVPRFYEERLVLSQASDLVPQWARRKKKGLRIFKNELYKLAQQQPLKWRDYTNISTEIANDVKKKEAFEAKLDQLRLYLSEWRELLNDFLILAYDDQHFFALAVKLYKDDLTALYLLHWYADLYADEKTQELISQALAACTKAFKQHRKKASPPTFFSSQAEFFKRDHTGKIAQTHFKHQLQLGKNRATPVPSRPLSEVELELRDRWAQLPDKIFEDLCVALESHLYSDIKKRLLVKYMLEAVLIKDLDKVLRLLRNKHPPTGLIGDLRKHLQQTLQKAYDLPHPPALGIPYAWVKGLLTQLRALLDYALLDLGARNLLDHDTLRLWHTPRKKEQQKRQLQTQIQFMEEKQFKKLLTKCFQPFHLVFTSSRRQVIRALLYLLADPGQGQQAVVELLEQTDRQTTSKKYVPPKELLMKAIVHIPNTLHLDLKRYLATQQGTRIKLVNYPSDTHQVVTRLLRQTCQEITRKKLPELYAVPQVKQLVFNSKNRGRKQGSVVFLESTNSGKTFKVHVLPTANKTDVLTFNAVNWLRTKQEQLIKKEQRLNKDETEQNINIHALEQTITDSNVLTIAQSLTQSTNKKTILLKARETTLDRLASHKNWYKQLDEALQNGIDYGAAATQAFKQIIDTKNTKDKLNQKTYLNTIDWVGQKGVPNKLWEKWKQVGHWEDWDEPAQLFNEISNVLTETITKQINQLIQKVHKEGKKGTHTLQEAWQNLAEACENYATNQEQPEQPVWLNFPQWTKTDVRHLQTLQALIMKRKNTWDSLLITWLALRSIKTKGQQEQSSSQPTDENIQDLLTALAKLCQNVPAEQRALEARQQSKSQKRYKAFSLRTVSQKVYLDLMFQIPTWQGQQQQKPGITAGDRGIRKPVVLTSKHQESKTSVVLKNEAIRPKQHRQNQDLRYTQRKVHKQLFQGVSIADQEMYDHKLAHPTTPNHLRHSHHKIQSVHAKKTRMNETYMHEMASRTVEFIKWTQTGELILEHLDYQPPAGLGGLSQTLSSNMWGSYLAKTEFKLHMTNQKVNISYIPPQYSSKICARWLDQQVAEWQKNSPKEPIQIKHLVMNTCYPVTAYGSRSKDDTGEWFYCAGHGKPASWTDRDQNASENFTGLQWIYNYNRPFKHLTSKNRPQASSTLTGGDHV
ncbi:MAG: hypothetical protein ACFFC7_01470 [Candidatus Hermodarchaeota archaeon]